MKFKLAFLFILVSILTFSQTVIEGSYDLTNGGGFYGDSYVFTKDGRFEFSSGHCTGGSYGKGSYRIHGKKLKLEFKSESNSIESSFEVSDNNTLGSFEKIDFVVRDKRDSSLIPFCNIILRDTLNKDLFLSGASTNFNGKASLVIEKGTLIEFKFVGYKGLYIPLKKKFFGKTMTVYLSDSWIKYLDSKDDCQFRIKKIKNDGFLLKRKGEKRYLRYKKNEKGSQ